MDLKKNIMMIVSVMVAVIIALSVLVPVIQDSSASEDTFTNEGYFYMDIVKDNDTHTLSWDYENPTIIVVDGDNVPLPTGNGNWTICGTKDFMVRYLAQTNNKSINLYSHDNVSLHAEVSANTSMTITLTADTVTATNTKETPETVTITDLNTIYYIVADKGPYVMKYADKPAYLTDESVIGICRTTSSGVNVCYSLFGTIDDGFTIQQFYGNTATFGDITVNDNEVSAYEGLYTLDNFTFSITNPGGTTDATVSYFIVPTEVTAERTIHVTPIEASLLGIIPLLVVIGIVIGAVWFIRQKN